jgi:NTE family protein
MDIDIDIDNNLDKEIHNILNQSNDVNDVNDVNYVNDLNKSNELNDLDKLNILIMSGGGIKSAGHIGAVYGLESCGMLNNITTYACTSGGGLIAVLLICGYKPYEILEILIGIGTKKFTSNKNINFFTDYGIDDGNRLMMIYAKLLLAKGYKSNITFTDLYNSTKKHLILTGTCLNDKNIYYFSKDSYPNMEVLKALRITISLPPVFTPVKFEDKLFIDGGLLDNYPIRLFDNQINNVIGIYLNGKKKYTNDISNIEDYFSNIFNCILEGIAKNDYKGYEKYTNIIEIDTDSPLSTVCDKNLLLESFNKGFNIITKKYKKYKQSE